ncbi:M20 metallopeptidase family protein [Sulfobacillus thermosulfidooxidans]|uniref:M20 metallopeptidase family protein n=1 Tax=Sulfobacillus thermosulfidooxidans TaxID=28034 RepID=UPI00040AE1D1|nr:amidohydrolase [Sulfobacillus thermosulfidooxidans]
MIPDNILALAPEIIQWRRHLHAHPELGYEEYDTQQFILSTLRSMGHHPKVAGDTGVVVDIGTSGPMVLARADIDALPITEDSQVDYRSQREGAMHACGHDGHTAMLLGVARVLPYYLGKHSGRARLIFQPAEERHPGGALKMIRDGVLDGVVRVTGLHLQSELPAGKIGARLGVQSANSDRFDIVIEGKGGHGSAPHHTIDPIPVMAQMIMAMQTIVSRQISPTDAAVLTISAVKSGSAYNAIPSRAELKGTVRTFKTDVQDKVIERLRQIVENTAATFGAHAELQYRKGYPSVVNSQEEWKIFKAVVENFAGRDAWIDVDERMGGEDFAYYLQQRPGVFWNLGAHDPQYPYPHHHNQFNFAESVMPLGVWIMVQTILAFSAAPLSLSDTQGQETF